MNWPSFLIVLVLMIIAFQANQYFIGVAFAVLAALMITAKALVKGKAKLGKHRGNVMKGLEAEWVKVEGAKMHHPQGKVMQYTDAVAKKTADHLMAKEEEKWAAPNLISSFSQGCKNFIKECNDWLKK